MRDWGNLLTSVWISSLLSNVALWIGVVMEMESYYTYTVLCIQILFILCWNLLEYSSWRRNLQEANSLLMEAGRLGATIRGRILHENVPGGPRKGLRSQYTVDVVFPAFSRMLEFLTNHPHFGRNYQPCPYYETRYAVTIHCGTITLNLYHCANYDAVVWLTCDRIHHDSSYPLWNIGSFHVTIRPQLLRYDLPEQEIMIQDKLKWGVVELLPGKLKSLEDKHVVKCLNHIRDNYVACGWKLAVPVLRGGIPNTVLINNPKEFYNILNQLLDEIR